MFNWVTHSKTRLRMLKLFFRDIPRSMYGLEISQKLKASPGTTHRELNAMVKQKILHKKKQGALVLYQLNTAHPHFLELQKQIKPPSKSDTIIFVGDTHFSQQLDESKNEAFQKLLHYTEKNAAELVLTGDIFETLQGDVFQTYLLHLHIITQLSHLATQIPVTTIIGNHDILLKAFLPESGQQTILNTKIQLAENYKNNKKGVHAEHGNRLNTLTDTKPLGIGKSLIESLNQLQQPNQSQQHLKEVAQLASNWQQYLKTITKQKNWQSNQLKKQLQEAEELLKNKQLKYAVFGHSHKALVQKVKGGTYANPGSWTKGEYQFLELKKKGIKLRNVSEI
jgi:UDP-2,3-diacylglucosamine pyrophosphatase LpxH